MSLTTVKVTVRENGSASTSLTAGREHQTRLIEKSCVFKLEMKFTAKALF